MPPARLCVVYLARLTHLRTHHLALLNPVEIQRRERYTLPDDRDRFTLGAVLLRTTVGRQLGVDPGAVDVTRVCERCGRQHGRPRLPGADLEASVSHSVDLVAVAITAAGPVGVDVEIIGEPSPDLIRSVCTSTEQAFVHTPRDFYSYWTRKEAVLKATGQGFDRDLTDVLVGPPAQDPELLAIAGARTPRCSMAELEVDGYAGAVAVLAADPVEFTVIETDLRSFEPQIS